MDIDLEEAMGKDAIVIAYLKDENIARDFYRALCNMRWKRIERLLPEEQTIDRLMGIESNVWSCSWRSAGGLIAEIRNQHYNTGEDYMDFYAGGFEGQVSELIKECFSRMGWEPLSYEL